MLGRKGHVSNNQNYIYFISFKLIKTVALNITNYNKNEVDNK